MSFQPKYLISISLLSPSEMTLVQDRPTYINIVPPLSILLEGAGIDNAGRCVKIVARGEGKGGGVSAFRT